MSKISKAAAAKSEQTNLRTSEIVTNFMGGDSYTVDPLTKLRLVSASSIFGEPTYYRGSSMSKKAPDGYAAKEFSRALSKYITGDVDILGLYGTEDKYSDTVDMMTQIIDEALDYDFAGTLDWAIELRNRFYIRLNPQVIMVRAAIHPKRKEFTEKFNGVFARVNDAVMLRPDDTMSQMAYYMYINGGKKNAIPSVIKRSWANKLSNLSRYAVAKYKNHEIGMINAVRICHAKGTVISELMQNGTVEVADNQQTWENMRSAGKKWEDIFKTINMGHMALLRNLRGFFSEVTDRDLRNEYLEKLKSGVLEGKQFPFRYYSAYCAVEKANDIDGKQVILDCLEECIDISINNMPKLKGKTMCLSDNSGSAWGSFTSEYGSVVVAEIDNLSAVITAMCSDEGYVGKFGDKLKIYPISKRTGALRQAREISAKRDDDVGGATEGGIWEFFNNAIKNKEHWDNIFIYSDQQAGTGRLFGTRAHKDEYNRMGYDTDYGMINVFKLVLDYRKRVFRNVNVFSVQTAGYDNMVVPGYAYRTNLMYGWTGKEAIFADTIIKEWNMVDAKNRE